MALFRRASGREHADGRWVVAGLGNPERRYAGTRHNVGAMVLDVLLSRIGGRLKRHKSGCLVAEGTLAAARAVLARPATYVNESGRPLRALLDWYKVPAARFLVVHDELDIPFGLVRVKSGGGTAGHNGLNSIASHLGTKSFVRVRVGISRPRGGSDSADYVLSDFSAAERKQLPEVVGRAADAVESVMASGVERAMNEVNAREDAGRS